MKFSDIPRPSAQQLSTFFSFALVYYVLPALILVASAVVVGNMSPRLAPVSSALIFLGLAAPFIQFTHHVFNRRPYRVSALIGTMFGYTLLVSIIPVMFYLTVGLAGASAVVEVNYAAASAYLYIAPVLGSMIGFITEVLARRAPRENLTPSPSDKARVNLAGLIERSLTWRSRRVNSPVVNETEMSTT